MHKVPTLWRLVIPTRHCMTVTGMGMTVADTEVDMHKVVTITNNSRL